MKPRGKGKKRTVAEYRGALAHLVTRIANGDGWFVPDHFGRMFSRLPGASWSGSDVDMLAARVMAGEETEPTPEGQVDDEENAAILERVNETGEIFISHTRLYGRYVLRLAIGNARTTEEDVQRAWDVLRREAAAL